MNSQNIKSMLQKDDWKEIMVEAGMTGKHITQFLIDLGISFEEHEWLIGNNKKYQQAYSEYVKHCENYWFSMARLSMIDNHGKDFNSRLWSLIMKNKFSDRWNESQKVDLTSKGEKLNESGPIKIEIIKKQLDEEK